MQVGRCWQPPGTGITGGYGSLFWVLGTSSRSSARTESTCNHWATAHASRFGLLVVLARSLSCWTWNFQIKLNCPEGARINLSLPSITNTISTCHHIQIYLFFFLNSWDRVSPCSLCWPLPSNAGIKGMDHNAQFYIQIFFLYRFKLKSSYFFILLW